LKFVELSFAGICISAIFERIKLSQRIIVGSLSESQLKSVRFLVGESDALITSDALAKIIKINH
jgi:hypothetical protein